MAERLVRDHEADGRERSDSPIICESSLGDNPDVRMTKGDGKRPFTDLEPDTALNNIPRVGSIRKSEQYREFLVDRKTKGNGKGPFTDLKDEASRVAFQSTFPEPMRDFLAYLKRGGDLVPFYSSSSKPVEGILYEPEKTIICTFYGRGSGCERGDNCPWRHVMPNTGDLSQHKRKQREIEDPGMEILGLARARNLEAQRIILDNGRKITRAGLVDQQGDVVAHSGFVMSQPPPMLSADSLSEDSFSSDLI